MKLGGARAAAFCARPDGGAVGALLYGPDSGLVALRRRELVQALTEGDDLRLTRLDAAAVLRAPAELDAALRARGFFPGRRVVLVEGAGDALARPLAAMLREIRPEDAFLLVTAGSLASRSALRKLFETGERLVALAFYPAPPDAAELEALLEAAGLAGALTPEALADLARAAQEMDRGALMQLIETIATYALDREAPLDAAELRPLLPEAVEGELDRLVAAVAEGRAGTVGPLMRRLGASGVGPVSILIAAGRHFRLLLGLDAAPDGVGAALGRVKPPVYGPRRDALAAQVRRWDRRRIEAGLRMLFETDRRLRSPGERPDRALVERCLVRLAIMAARR